MKSKQTQMKWVVLFLACFFLAAGCAHEMRGFPPRAEQPPPLPRPAPYGQPQELEQRIRTIRVMLEDTQLGPDDRLLAQDLLKTYHAFERASLSTLDEEHRSLIQLLFSNLIRLDERYFRSLSPKDGQGPQAMTLFVGKRKKILENYLSGDYQGVIDSAVELENIFGADFLTQEINLVFAISLAKQGMVQEALRLGTRISDDLERTPGFIELRARMVEWQLALGDRKGAVRSYEKLVDDMHETETFLKGAERNISGHRREKAFAEKREPPLSVGFAQEPPSLQEVLDQAEAMVQKYDFHAAKLLLLRLKIRLPSGAEADLVDQAMKSVELAEEKSWEQERSDASKKRESLELAAALVEQEKYEEAVMQIEGAAWGNELGPEAKQLQDLAVEKIVNRQRNEAAKLFLMARNTLDPAKKEGFLIASHNILKALLEKYPSTPLYQTINDNIRRIEEELSKVKKSS